MHLLVHMTSVFLIFLCSIRPPFQSYALYNQSLQQLPAEGKSSANLKVQHEEQPRALGVDASQTYQSSTTDLENEGLVVVVLPYEY